MDDLLKIIFYVAAVVIYALIKMRKKPDASKPFIPQAPKKAMPHTVPPKTFADTPPKKSGPILERSIEKLEREIKETKQKIKPQKFIRAGKVEAEKNQYETTADRLDAIENEKNVQDHFNKVQNYDEMINYKSSLISDDAPLFNYESEDDRRKNPYSEFLKDPENIKTAFVLKEIFDRKQY